MNYWWKRYLHFKQNEAAEEVVEELLRRATNDEPEPEWQDWSNPMRKARQAHRDLWFSESEDEEELKRLSLELYHWVKVTGFVEYGGTGEGAEHQVFMALGTETQHPEYRHRFRFYPGIIVKPSEGQKK